MMPMMWMLMAQTIMSAITTACFSLSRGAGERAPVERSGAGTLNARRGDRQRQVRQAALSPWVPREWPLACLLAVQAMGVFHQQRIRRVGFGFLLRRHKDRLAEVQGVQEVAGTQLAPVVKNLRQVDVVATPDVALPALARGRYAKPHFHHGAHGSGTSQPYAHQ